LFADQIPMLRSAFAARITELVGEPAMSYATCWRMHLAGAALLCGEGATVAALAERFGYRPRPRPPARSSAFWKHHPVPYSGWRVDRP
jgi:hypothetical protein